MMHCIGKDDALLTQLETIYCWHVMPLLTAWGLHYLTLWIMVCHATNGPPKIGPPGPSSAKYVAVDGPRTKYGFHRWSPGPSVAP